MEGNREGITDLVRNQDLIDQEHREYIVGYICKIVDRRKLRQRSHRS